MNSRGRGGNIRGGVYGSPSQRLERPLDLTRDDTYSQVPTKLEHFEQPDSDWPDQPDGQGYVPSYRHDDRSYSESPRSYSESPRSQQSQSSKSNSKRGRGLDYTEEELSSILLCIYKNYDPPQVWADFKKRNPATNRKQPSVIAKYNHLKQGLMFSLLGKALEEPEADNSSDSYTPTKKKKVPLNFEARALDFLKPSLITKNDETFFVVFIAGFQKVSIGSHGQTVQIELVKVIGDDLDFEFEESKNRVVLQFVLPDDFLIGDRVATDVYKGFQIKQKQIQDVARAETDPFAMS